MRKSDGGDGSETAKITTGGIAERMHGDVLQRRTL
jgi:hypothetical protein